MGRKRIGGFIFEWYIGDHRPYHIHVYKDDVHLGRFDLEQQKPMKDLQMTNTLRQALIAGGFMRGEQNGSSQKN